MTYIMEYIDDAGWIITSSLDDNAYIFRNSYIAQLCYGALIRGCDPAKVEKYEIMDRKLSELKKEDMYNDQCDYSRRRSA